jgi:nucleoside 2-deoxyribosyltransferase
MKERLKWSIFYLAGPIQYASDLGVEWRKKATQFLHSLNIGVINPCDKPTDIAKEDENTQSYLQSLKDNKKYDEYSSFIKEIVSVDLRFVDKSDAILAYISKDVFSCGTFHETAHAFLQRKPVIIFTDKDISNIPGWMYGHGNWKMFYPSLDEALEYIRHIHQDENVETLNRWKFLNYDKIYGRSPI